MLDAATYTPRLREQYKTSIRPALKEEFGYKNVMMIPRLEKIVLNMGIGEAVADSKKIKSAHDDLMAIAGQKPVITKAKKSIAGFKVREEMPLGVKVTLRGDRMWEFFDRLLSVAIPRIRDFRGLPAHSWDGRGNYTFGLNDQTVFPEIDVDKVDQQRGMDITIVTSATTNEAGKALLDAYGFPFKQGADADTAPRRRKRRNPMQGKKKK